MIANNRFQHSRRQVLRATSAAVLLGMVGLVTCPRLASAEEETRSADVAAARDLAIEGLKLADAGQCAQALDKLARAEKLHHAPIVLGRLGECEIAEGKIVDGTESLRKLLRESLPSNPPQALLKARERAQSVLDAAKPKIAILTISVREPAENLAVTVDGQAVPPALFDRGRPTDPGEHVVEASAPGFLTWSRQVALGPGDKEEVVVKLNVDPEAAAKAKNEAAASEGGHAADPKVVPSPKRAASQDVPANSEVPPASPSYAPSYVLWSVGTAAAAVGGVFGYLALKGKRDLDKQCVNSICPVETQSDLDSARRNGLLSTILLSSGGGLIAIGTVVFLLTGPSTEKDPAPATASVRPMLGLGQLGLQGQF